MACSRCESPRCFLGANPRLVVDAAGQELVQLDVHAREAVEAGSCDGATSTYTGLDQQPQQQRVRLRPRRPRAGSLPWSKRGTPISRRATSSMCAKACMATTTAGTLRSPPPPGAAVGRPGASGTVGCIRAR
jgi:hypothetical protein